MLTARQLGLPGAGGRAAVVSVAERSVRSGNWDWDWGEAREGDSTRSLPVQHWWTRRDRSATARPNRARRERARANRRIRFFSPVQQCFSFSSAPLLSSSLLFSARPPARESETERESEEDGRRVDRNSSRPSIWTKFVPKVGKTGHVRGVIRILKVSPTGRIHFVKGFTILNRKKLPNPKRRLLSPPFARRTPRRRPLPSLYPLPPKRRVKPSLLTIEPSLNWLPRIDSASISCMSSSGCLSSVSLAATFSFPPQVLIRYICTAQCCPLRSCTYASSSFPHSLLFRPLCPFNRLITLSVALCTLVCIRRHTIVWSPLCSSYSTTSWKQVERWRSFAPAAIAAPPPPPPPRPPTFSSLHFLFPARSSRLFRSSAAASPRPCRRSKVFGWRTSG